jgi:hypothetical protein
LGRRKFYSSVTPADLMTARQRSISVAMKRAEVSGSVATGSAESSSNRARTSGDLIAQIAYLTTHLTTHMSNRSLILKAHFDTKSTERHEFISPPARPIG